MFEGKEVKVLLANAGAGKTSKLMDILFEELKTRRPEEIAFVTFTKKGASEGLRRACNKFKISPDELPYFRTLHSLTFRALNLNLKNIFGRIDERKFNKETGYYLNRCDASPHPSKDSKYLDFYDLERSNAMTSKQLAEADIEIGYYRQLVQKYEEYKNRQHLVDFFDCLIKYVREGDSLPCKVVMIDECQDITALQWQVINKAFANAERIYVAGDENQCQPEGSKVLTREGYKNIEDLKSSDCLVTFAQNDYAYYGLRSTEYHPEVAHRPYRGSLYNVNVDGVVNRFTPNHRMIVRWLNRDTSLQCVYLMKKGEQFRVGQCQLFNSVGATHFITRMNNEQAEAGWILRVCKTKEEALIYEQYYSFAYGIPQISWKNWCTKDMQNKVYALLGSLEGKASDLLISVHRNINYPMFNHEKNQAKSGGTCISLCEACNLIPEVMQLPVYQDKSHIDKASLWKSFSLTYEYYDGLVYSLNVPKYHTYVTAGGLTVHNSIYTYAGARPDYLISLANKYPRIELNASYRLPKNVYNVAKGIVGMIQEKTDKAFNFKEGNIDGNVVSLNNLDRLKNFMRLDELKDDKVCQWYLLARNNCFLDEYTKFLEDNLIPYWNSDGFFMGGEIMSRIKDYNGFALEGYKTPDKREKFREKFGVVDFSVPFYETNLFTEGRKWVYASYIEKYGLDKLQEMCKWNPQVLVSTIHFVKGGEAKNVAIMLDSTARSYGEIYDNLDSELRVLYVGVTRARENLFIIDSKSNFGYDKLLNVVKDENDLKW